MASWLSFSSYCNSQDIQTTPNLIGNQWSGAVVGGNYSPGGTSGGNKPAYNPSTNTILFGYTQSTVEQAIKVSTALNGTGIRVIGYEWRFEFLNAGYSSGSLSFKVVSKNSAGAALQTDNYSLSSSGNTSEWATYSGNRDYASQYSLAQIDTVNLSFTGKDSRYWAGYYGPQVRNVNFSLRYVPDECAINPLSSKSCPNYEEYNFALQCSANSLYDPKCPGYEFTQCSMNPLYAPTCAGYQQAMLNQQCPLNALYNPMCPGYQQAYLNQQCVLNVFFSKECPGYAKAMFEKTCAENPLANTSCPLYESAYLNQQCALNPLFSTACPLYQQTFFNQQCAANPLYNSGCPGYADAFRKKQVIETVTQPSTSTTATTAVSSPLSAPSVGNEDVAKLLATPQITSDPIVNQVIAKPEEKIQTPQPLGQGLSVSSSPSSGSQSPSRSSTQQSQSRSSARENARAAAVASQRSGSRDPQDVALASMAEVPGFSQYQEVKIPDVPFYKPEDIYKRATIQDNARALRQLNQRSDRIHKEMVDEQYRK